MRRLLAHAVPPLVILAFVPPSLAQEAPSWLQLASISAGTGHTCALSAQGTAFCWGNNEAGQLGAPSSRECKLEGQKFLCSTAPLPIEGGIVFETIAAGGYHTCGLTPAGEAYCWGDNKAGQLGTATSPDSCSADKGPPYPCARAPVPVSGELRFRDIMAGAEHTCAVSTQGTARPLP